MAPRTPRAGSLNAKLASIGDVGGYFYFEVNAGEREISDAVQRLQARVLASSRYPGSMGGAKFAVSAYTAVGTVLGAVRTLVRVERVA